MTTIRPSHNGRSPSRDQNPGPQEHELDIIPTRPHSSLLLVWQQLDARWHQFRPSRFRNDICKKRNMATDFLVGMNLRSELFSFWTSSIVRCSSKNPATLCAIHHRQNPLKSTYERAFPGAVYICPVIRIFFTPVALQPNFGPWPPLWNFPFYFGY
jgi:hypothetical protein